MNQRYSELLKSHLRKKYSYVREKYVSITDLDKNQKPIMWCFGKADIRKTILVIDRNQLNYKFNSFLAEKRFYNLRMIHLTYCRNNTEP